MANFSILKFLAVALIFSLEVSSLDLPSPPVTDWGTWGTLRNCPKGTFAQGFQLKTQANQLLGDDTALNAIKLFCGNPAEPTVKTITSTEGQFGKWGLIYSCYPGFLTGYVLRVEPERPLQDNTATNNVRFFCSAKNDPGYIEGDGTTWGRWTTELHCNENQAICGLKTQVEKFKLLGDNTSLNNIMAQCCDRNVTSTSTNL